MIRLQQRPLFGFLADPFGKSARAMELDGDQIRIMRGGQLVSMSLQALVTPPALRRGMLGTALTIRASDYGDVDLHRFRSGQVLMLGGLLFESHG